MNDVTGVYHRLKRSHSIDHSIGKCSYRLLLFFFLNFIWFLFFSLSLILKTRWTKQKKINIARFRQGFLTNLRQQQRGPRPIYTYKWLECRPPGRRTMSCTNWKIGWCTIWAMRWSLSVAAQAENRQQEILSDFNMSDTVL